MLIRVNQSTPYGYYVRAIGYKLSSNCITKMIGHNSRTSGVNMEPSGLRQSYRGEERQQKGQGNIIWAPELTIAYSMGNLYSLVVYTNKFCFMLMAICFGFLLSVIKNSSINERFMCRQKKKSEA